MDSIYPEGVNLSGPEWASFCKWLEQEKLELLNKLSNPNTDWDATQLIRGQAAYITKLLDLRENAAAFSRPR